MENIVVMSNGRRTTTFFSFFFVFVYGLSLYYTSVDNSENVSSSTTAPVLTATAESYLFLYVVISLGFCLAALLVVVAVRATVVTWITVLVLLAFAGKRRKSLVREGRKITTDVTMYTIKFGLKGRSLIAIAFAILLSFIALVRRREGWID